MPPVVGRALPIILILGASGALAACGTSGHPAAATTAYPAAAKTLGAASSVTGSGSSLTKAQAQAFARAVNLTAADVPGFRVSAKHEHEHETGAEKRLEHELTRCAGGLGSKKGIEEASSKEFQRESNALQWTVQSEVSVARSSSLAAKELAVIRSGRTRACLAHYIDLLFKGKRYRGATVSPVSISQGTPPAPGATGSVGWRITATISLQGIRLRFYLDILGFVDGPAEVTLLTSGIPEPFPAATEQRLFGLLLERARSHLG